MSMSGDKPGPHNLSEYSRRDFSDHEAVLRELRWLRARLKRINALIAKIEAHQTGVSEKRRSRKEAEG